MGITIEKLEGKEGIMKLLDMLSGGEASQHATKLREAKAKMEKAGFSNDAMATLAEFTAHIDDLAGVIAVAVTTAERTQNRDAGEFAIAAMKWMTVGLNNCHSMFEKADVDPNLFGLRARSEGYPEFLQKRMRQCKETIKTHTEYVAKDTLGNTMKLAGATEGEAAIEALSNFGYTLSIVRK
jgi:hypothetical protein